MSYQTDALFGKAEQNVVVKVAHGAEKQNICGFIKIKLHICIYMLNLTNKIAYRKHMSMPSIY